MSDVDDEEIGPMTSTRCPECEYDRARYEIETGNAADERASDAPACDDTP